MIFMEQRLVGKQGFTATSRKQKRHGIRYSSNENWVIFYCPRGVKKWVYKQGHKLLYFALNCNYYLQDCSWFKFSLSLNKQIHPGELKFLFSTNNQATNKLYAYILLDLNQNTPGELRVVTDIFDSEITLYIPVNSKKKFISCHHATDKNTWKQTFIFSTM